jgi:hypothetical protein
MDNIGNNKYPEEIQEVSNIMKSKAILSGGVLPGGVDAKVIVDVSQIPGDSYYEDFKDERPLWRDIIAIEASKFFCIEPNQWKIQMSGGRVILAEIADEIEQHLRNEIPDKYKKYYFEQEIAGHCKYLILCRLVEGKTNSFFELLFDIYKSGGYPCGWEGYYPRGRLIVYYPKRPLRK